MIFRGEAMQQLVKKLNNWLESHEPFTLELAKSPGDDQSFLWEVGPSEQIISSREKPVCGVSYVAGAHNSRCAFVVDQTCISELVEGLTRALDRT